MTEVREPELAELAIADPPERWAALGFDVDPDTGHVDVGGVRIRLGEPGHGITSWSLRRVSVLGTLDGLSTPNPSILRPPPYATHPNGATGLDHVVVVTPDFDRTARALDRAGLPLRRTREDVPGKGRLGFRRVGPAILELVHAPQLDSGDARFWGLAFVVVDLDELAERLGDDLGEIRTAVQPGRRIATLRSTAGLTPAVAFMSPDPA
jgi:hypothetical protein